MFTGNYKILIKNNIVHIVAFYFPVFQFSADLVQLYQTKKIEGYFFLVLHVSFSCCNSDFKNLTCNSSY